MKKKKSSSNTLKIDENKKLQLKQAMIQQYKRCYQSPVYFLKKYATIQHPTKGAIKFNLYPFQQEALIDFVQHPWNIILKSRQLGISTLCAGYILWFCTFQKDKSVLVIANTQGVATNLIRKIKLMYQHLPSWLKQEIIIDNKLSLQFANNSSVKASSANSNAGVSEALSLLVFDEAAVLKQSLASQIWSSAMPTLSCLEQNQFITIKNKNTGLIEHIKLRQLYDRM